MVLCGITNTGKTQFAKSFALSKGYRLLFFRNINQIKDYDLSELKNVILLFDDLDFIKFSKQERIHITDVTDLTVLRVLYGLGLIPPGIKRMFTINDSNHLTNNHPEVIRRCRILHVREPLYSNNCTINVFNFNIDSTSGIECMSDDLREVERNVLPTIPILEKDTVLLPSTTSELGVDNTLERSGNKEPHTQ